MTVETLILRCDADARVGHGHVARCRALARALRAWRPLFAGAFDAHARAALAAEGLDVRETPPIAADDFAWAGAHDAARCAVLVDSYEFTAAQGAHLGAAGLRWGAFDDYNALDFSGARFVINFRVGAERWARYAARVCLLGAGVMPVSAALVALRARLAGRRPPAGGVVRVLAAIGGSDRHGAGRQLAADFAGHADLLLTLVDVNDELRGAALPGNVRAVPRVPDLAALLGDADVVVSGGGRTKYEACFLGLPTVVINQTEGEAQDTALLEQAGLCLRAADAWKVCAGVGPPAVRAALARGAALRAACLSAFPDDPTARLVEGLERALLSPA